MFLLKLKNLKHKLTGNSFYYFLLAFFVFLPFQFALNPAAGFDVAIVRIIIPAIFLISIFLKIKTAKNSLPSDNLSYLIISFLFLAFLSIFFSQNITWSLRKLLFLLTLFPIYFITVQIFNTAEKKRAAIFSLVIGGTLLALIAILQFSAQFIFGIDHTYSFLANNVSSFFLGNSFAEAVLAYPSWLVNAGGITYMRAVAMFPDPHMLSYYFEMLIPWAIVLWASEKKHRAWLLIPALSLILADIFTFTRGSYIALIAGSFVVLPIVSKKTAIKIIFGAILLGTLFLIAPHNPVAGRLASSFDVQEGSNQARLTNFQQAMSVISSHPFGVGIGAYSLSVKPTATYREPIYAHNLYLDLTAELGIQTALIFIAIIFLSFQHFWQFSKKQPFFIAGVSSITIFSVHCLVENPLYSVHVLPLFLIIIALSVVGYKHEQADNLE